MYPRQLAALVAASALLVPAVGLLTAVPAHAAGPTVTMQAPEALGDGGGAVRFTATVANPGGPAVPDARLFLTLELDEFFTGVDGEPSLDGLLLQRLDAGGDWVEVPFTLDGESAVAPAGPAFALAAEEEVTVTFRALLDSYSGAGAAGFGQRSRAKIAPKAKRPGARGRDAHDLIAEQGKALLGSPPSADPAAGGDSCLLRAPGFLLRTELFAVDGAGEPTGAPLATDLDEVEAGIVSVAFGGLAGPLTAGAVPKPFTLTLCNETDSAYEDVYPALTLTREGGLNRSDVVLEAHTGRSWVPVPLEQFGPLVIAEFSDGTGIGAALAAGERSTARLRLGFAAGVRPGEATAIALTVLGGEELGGYDLAQLRVRAGQARRLPDSGADPRLALLGLALVAAGTVATRWAYLRG